MCVGKNRRHHCRVAPFAFKPRVCFGWARPYFGVLVLGEGLPGEGVIDLVGKAYRIDRHPGADGGLMRDGKMIAFHEVFGEELPIRLPDVILAGDGDVIGKPVARDMRLQFGQKLRDRRRVPC